MSVARAPSLSWSVHTHTHTNTHRDPQGQHVIKPQRALQSYEDARHWRRQSQQEKTVNLNLNWTARWLTCCCRCPLHVTTGQVPTTAACHSNSYCRHAARQVFSQSHVRGMKGHEARKPSSICSPSFYLREQIENYVFNYHEKDCLTIVFLVKKIWAVSAFTELCLFKGMNSHFFINCILSLSLVCRQTDFDFFLDIW